MTQILKEGLDVCKIFVLKNERWRVKGALLSEFFIWLGKRLVDGKEGNITEEEACFGGKDSSKSKDCQMRTVRKFMTVPNILPSKETDLQGAILKQEEILCHAIVVKH